MALKQKKFEIFFKAVGERRGGVSVGGGGGVNSIDANISIFFRSLTTFKNVFNQKFYFKMGLIRTTQKHGGYH